MVALKQMSTDLSRISNRVRENIVVFNASKTQFLHTSTRHNYDIFFENTQLKPLSVLNILDVSFSRNLGIFLGMITLLLFLNKLLRGWVLCCAFVIFFLSQSSCFHFI